MKDIPSAGNIPPGQSLKGGRKTRKTNRRNKKTHKRNRRNRSTK